MQDGFWLGKGTPVDQIDEYCKNLWYGYTCLKQDFGQNCESTRTYNWVVNSKKKPVCRKFKKQYDFPKNKIGFIFQTFIFEIAASFE
jgi:hypothetical protein